MKLLLLLAHNSRFCGTAHWYYLIFWAKYLHGLEKILHRHQEIFETSFSQFPACAGFQTS